MECARAMDGTRDPRGKRSIGEARPYFRSPPKIILKHINPAALSLKIEESVEQHFTRSELAPQKQERLSSSRTVNPDAYEFYAMGRYFLSRWPDDYERAIQYLDQAVARDPHYAPAHAALSLAYSGASFFLPASEINLKARASAQKALELDDTMDEAHSALGRYYAVYEWNWVAAEREVRRAIELNPNSWVAHRIYWSILGALGRFEEALDEARRARDLDPQSVGSYRALGWVHLKSRRYDEAITYYRRALELDPRHILSRQELARVYVFKAMYAEALKEYEVLGELGDRPELVYLYAVAGRRSEAVAMLDRLESRWNREAWVDSGRAAWTYAGLGDVDRVCAWMHRACDERDPELPWLLQDEYFDRVRHADCFQDLYRRVNLLP